MRVGAAIEVKLNTPGGSKQHFGRVRRPQVTTPGRVKSFVLCTNNLNERIDISLLKSIQACRDKAPTQNRTSKKKRPKQ